MITSLSATPSSYASPVQVGARQQTSLHTTPYQPVSYSPQLQKDAANGAQSSIASQSGKTVNSKDNIDSTSTGNTQDPTTEVQIQQVISQLRSRDSEVRAHEMAHLSAAGGYATGMNFSYQTGPDGKQYAVGGEVGIDTSKISGDPEANLAKARVVQRAALAPAQPSNQDYKVAASAQKTIQESQAEIAKQTAEANAKGANSAEKTDGTNSSETSAASVQNTNVFGLSSADTSNLKVDVAKMGQSTYIAERGVFETRLGVQQSTG